MPETRIERWFVGIGLLVVAALVALTALAWRSQEASQLTTVVVANAQGEQRPASAPRVIPLWAVQLRRWWVNHRGGPRPSAAPLPTPAWFWEWNAWKSGIKLEPAAPTPVRSDKLELSTPAGARSGRVALVLTAASGDSWLEVRLGSETGPLRYVGTLRRGRSLRVSGRQLWLRAGVADNLVALLNGKPAQELPRGVATLLVTPKGLRTVELE